MNASSSGVMSSFRKMGWYCGVKENFFTRSRTSSGSMCSPAAIIVDVVQDVAAGVAQQQRGKRRIVVDDDAPFAVQDLAARRQDGNVADAVLFRELGIIIAAHHLQPPQSEHQDQKNAENAVLHGSEPKLRYFFVAP